MRRRPRIDGGYLQSPHRDRTSGLPSLGGRVSAAPPALTRRLPRGPLAAARGGRSEARHEVRIS
ncbi:hypothetical protein [Halorubrum lacusprofundi]|uniref:hypothetical protein n=1 Tax=Halorubrum lacusprofundi TaxID=2247 RepID=UPI0012AB4E0F|nr:hypothetical protein [Halorubrum lacusprofundi]